MPSLTLTCPHCGFSREVPEQNVPEHASRVTCPKCGESFDFRKPEAVVPPVEEPAAAHMEPTPFPGGEPTPSEAPVRLRGMAELFKASWEIYLQRVGVLIGLYLLSILFLLVPVGLFALFGLLLSLIMPDIRAPLLIAAVLTGIAAGGIAFFWGLTAMILSVADNSLGIRSALEKGWGRIWSFIWVFLLIGFIVTGGFMLFVVPGIIFSVWFFLAQFVLAAEEERGMCALLKSKEYIKGIFPEVFVRLFLVWVVSMLLGMIPILGGILSLLFVPFMLIYSWLIYEDLRRNRERISLVCTTADKATWLLIGALGFIVVPIFFLLLTVGWLGVKLSSITLPWLTF